MVAALCFGVLSQPTPQSIFWVWSQSSWPDSLILAEPSNGGNNSGFLYLHFHRSTIAKWKSRAYPGEEGKYYGLGDYSSEKWRNVKGLPCTIQKIRDVENSKNQESEAEFSAISHRNWAFPGAPRNRAYLRNKLYFLPQTGQDHPVWWSAYFAF